VSGPPPDCTEGWLLGGRVRYDQPRAGFRSGIEPVLLAASIPARPGQLVLEGGCGAGAGLLCLAHRVPGLRGGGIERDPALAALAARNLAANGHDALTVRGADLLAAEAEGAVDHAFANPPYHRDSGPLSPSAARAMAKVAPAGLLHRWAAALARTLRPRGTLTFVLPAARLPEAMDAFDAAGCGTLSVLPLWPREGEAARLVLLRGIRGGRGDGQLLAGLALHLAGGGFTEAAGRILRDGAALPL
jgi:tRNA1(Val) A37 N6-methylase TrmN6